MPPVMRTVLLYAMLLAHDGEQGDAGDPHSIYTAKVNKLTCFDHRVLSSHVKLKGFAGILRTLKISQKKHTNRTELSAPLGAASGVGMSALHNWLVGTTVRPVQDFKQYSWW